MVPVCSLVSAVWKISALLSHQTFWKSLLFWESIRQKKKKRNKRKQTKMHSLCTSLSEHLSFLPGLPDWCNSRRFYTRGPLKKKKKQSEHLSLIFHAAFFPCSANTWKITRNPFSASSAITKTDYIQIVGAVSNLQIYLSVCWGGGQYAEQQRPPRMRQVKSSSWEQCHFITTHNKAMSNLQATANPPSSDSY